MPADPSSAIAVVTSSYVSLSSLQKPSTSELVTTSSVVSIPSRIFVRFGISVPLNQSVNNANFTKALKEGILMAYRNGSLGTSPGNVSISVSY